MLGYLGFDKSQMHPLLLPSSGTPDLVSARSLHEWPPSLSELRKHNFLLCIE